ncbi:hypothetical protein E3J62_03860 [candidate division TA06 bacterium]|uniref:DUF5916 domain-containing protein n=1 Tax=candidate division TA06 bacterium TaxID=2250710 RepID=A0A523UVA9_UNCT6|nr:MAG: hypothetical protein E3J62_03860 [candidate division TA06 bacterium]
MRMVASKGGKSALAFIPGLLAVLLTANLFAQPAETTPSNSKTIEVRTAEIAPVIDGVIERTWEAADSAYDFVQFAPHEKEPPTEKTVVYILQDKENLYIALRFHAQTNEPVACLTSDEDYIAIGIDPFGSKNTAYYFIVYASGIRQDGWVLDDGRARDDSWEGVWYRGVKVLDDRWQVEIKIPFKSIRYKKGLDRWGIQFVRYSASNRETDYWTEVSQLESDMVSKYGSLHGINPQVTGYYFELYPEAFVRYEDYEGEKGKLEPRVSMNFKWDLTPQTTLNATAYPDFAQIETDPFTLNLSRYRTYYGERRPFFIEGMEVFRMSHFGDDKGFFRPLNIFYSRTIGKSVDGDVIPIIGGLKLTTKSEDWNAGIFGAYTDEYSENDSLIEPYRSFAVCRLKHRQFGNSDIGVLFSGTMVDGDDYNYAVGLDGVMRRGVNQFIVQGTVSDRSSKKGWAVSSGYHGFLGNFLTMGAVEVVGDSFDVSDIGYVPWAGRKKFTFISGPFKTYEKGALRNLYFAPGIIGIQEPGQDEWSTLGYFILNPVFRNDWGFSLELHGGPAHEADTSYLNRSVDLSGWANLAGQSTNFGGNYSYGYNYARGFLAHQASTWFRVGYGIVPEVSASLRSSIWAEWDTTGAVAALTTSATPRIDYRINADMSLGLFNEFVMGTPGTDVGNTDLLYNRIGLLFSWNFLPKSWLYVAFNDSREIDAAGDLRLVSGIGAIKAKYLMYF